MRACVRACVRVSVCLSVCLSVSVCACLVSVSLFLMSVDITGFSSCGLQASWGSNSRWADNNSEAPLKGV